MKILKIFVIIIFVTTKYVKENSIRILFKTKESDENRKITTKSYSNKVVQGCSIPYYLSIVLDISI